MKKEDVLKYMGWGRLPKPQEESTLKCPVLVRRTNSVTDYAISQGGRIVADKDFRAMIIEVIEYYPKIKSEDVHIPVIEDKNKGSRKGKADVKKPERKKGDPTIREQMIEFLVSKKNKRELMESKTTDELEKLSKLFGGEF